MKNHERCGGYLAKIENGRRSWFTSDQGCSYSVPIGEQLIVSPLFTIILTIETEGTQS